MTQILPFACPNVTCKAFGVPVDILCWELGECIGGWPEYDAVGEPECEDHGRCGACDCHVASLSEWRDAVKRMCES